MTPPLHIHITPSDDAPIYRQIVRQVAEGIALGSLAPGERLPSLRELGQRLVVAPLTIKKAYDELESQELIETRRGQGTFVRADAASTQVSSDAAADRLRPAVRRLLLEARLVGVGEKELGQLIQEERTVLEEERERQGDLPASDSSAASVTEGE